MGASCWAAGVAAGTGQIAALRRLPPAEAGVGTGPEAQASAAAVAPSSSHCSALAHWVLALGAGAVVCPGVKVGGQPCSSGAAVGVECSRVGIRQ